MKHREKKLLLATLILTFLLPSQAKSDSTFPDSQLFLHGGGTAKRITGASTSEILNGSYLDSIGNENKFEAKFSPSPTPTIYTENSVYALSELLNYKSYVSFSYSFMYSGPEDTYIPLSIYSRISLSSDSPVQDTPRYKTSSNMIGLINISEGKIANEFNGIVNHYINLNSSTSYYNSYFSTTAKELIDGNIVNLTIDYPYLVQIDREYFDSITIESNQTYTINMISSTTAYNSSGSSLVDPLIQIDTSFKDAYKFNLILSDGICNTPTNTTPVPAPSGIILLGTGCLSFLFLSRKRKEQSL